VEKKFYKKVCSGCKKEFQISGHLNRPNRKFCTKACFLKNKVPYWLGKKRPTFTEDWKKKISISQSGENNYQWIKDRTKLCRISKQGERRTSAYFNWRKEVWARDCWKCKINNSDCKGRLEAHHILGFTDYPELRYEVNNGITLCHFHHPRKWEEEKRLSPYFKNLVSVSKE
jgi:hypothetical protein